MESAKVGLLNEVPNTARTSYPPLLSEEAFGIRTSRETERYAEDRKCPSYVHYLNGEAMWSPYESGYSIEFEAPRCTSCVPLLSKEAIWNTYESGTERCAKHRNCTSCVHFLHGEDMWNPYESATQQSSKHRAAHLAYPCLAKKPF